MKRVIGAILFVIYSIIAITVTVLLLSFNEYNCSEIGGYTVYIANDDSLEPQYKQGSILLVKQTSDKNVQIGDELLLYKVINSTEYEVVNRKLVGKTQQGSHIMYEVEKNEVDANNQITGSITGNENYANDYLIGKIDDTIVIEGPWGTLLSILESKWGYLFCIVVVSLLLFLQEVFDLVIEIKYGGSKVAKVAKGVNSVNATASVAGGTPNMQNVAQKASNNIKQE